MKVHTLPLFFRQARLPLLLGLAMSSVLSACDSSPAPRTVKPAPPIQQPPSNDRGTGNLADNGANGTQRQRQAEFLNRLRQADPQFKTIDRAVLNEQNELGLILDHSVDMDSIPALMRTMLAQLAKEFPGQDLNVIAYAPSKPPIKIGTAHLDARTRDMTYTKEHP